MKSLELKHQQKTRRIRRIRTKIHGTNERPRLIVVISNRSVSAQVIDDEKGRTLVSVNGNATKASGTLTEQAAKTGEEIAKSALAKKVKSVVFDRRGRIYHGRVKAFADAARSAGLEF